MPAAAAPHPITVVPPTALTPIVIATFMASLGTGVMWNGLAFIAEHVHGYGPRQSLMLAIAQGSAYLVAAFAAGRLMRAMEQACSPRSLLILVFLVQALAGTLPWFARGEWTLWTVAIVVSMASAVQWPLIESYLTAGRVGPVMRSALGWWNVVWMSAVALSLMLTGVAIDGDNATWALGALGPISALCALTCLAFGATPGEHLHDDTEVVPRTYRSQLATVRVLLPVSYVIVAAMSPLLPYLTGQFELSAGVRTLISATWLVGRLGAVAVLWRTHGWHGKWWTLLVAALLSAVGFAVAVLAPSVAMLVVGLAAFGVGQGIIYYTALYYAMAVGNAEVDAAGTHEGLIGVGYAIGPCIGLFSTLAASDDLWRNRLFVIAIWAVMALVAWPALRPWTQERKRASAP